MATKFLIYKFIWNHWSSAKYHGLLIKIIMYNIRSDLGVGVSKSGIFQKTDVAIYASPSNSSQFKATPWKS